jgi:hypothetical protein
VSTRRGKVKKENRWLVGAVCLAGVILLLMFQAQTWLPSKQTRLTDQQTREILNRELPPGSSRSRVIEFLKSQRWTYSDEGATVRAMFRDASQSISVRTDIQMRFYFDSDGKLTSYEIQDLLTGL